MVYQVGRSGDVRGEHVLAGDGNAHLKNGAQQNRVGALRSRTVYGCNLDAEVVDDRLAHGAVLGTVYCEFGCGHQYPLLQKDVAEGELSIIRQGASGVKSNRRILTRPRVNIGR